MLTRLTGIAMTVIGLTIWVMAVHAGNLLVQGRSDMREAPMTSSPGSSAPEGVIRKTCWVEVYEDDNFDQDDPHALVEGPAEFPTLKRFGGRDWSNDIESLIVGPSATVRAYTKEDFQGTEVAFVPNQRIPKLSKLSMSNEIESLKITCGPPEAPQ
jgi:hypothetical protein